MTNTFFSISHFDININIVILLLLNWKLTLLDMTVSYFVLQISSVPRLEQRITCMKIKLDFIEQLADVKPVSTAIFN